MLNHLLNKIIFKFHGTSVEKKHCTKMIVMASNHTVGYRGKSNQITVLLQVTPHPPSSKITRLTI